MTPFVDVAFLILFFFIMATKFKPPETAVITTPKSVSTDKLKEQDALLMEFDSSGRVFFTMNVKSPADSGLKQYLIEQISKSQNLNLSARQIRNFTKNTTVGVPFSQLPALLDSDPAARTGDKQTGVPVDSTNNQLKVWIATAIATFQGHQVNFMVKGDNKAKYPVFEAILDALRANDQFRYQLVTDPKGVPQGSELSRLPKTAAKEEAK